MTKKKKIMGEDFKPNSPGDIPLKAMKIRNNELLSSSSELGIIIAATDAFAGDDSLFILKKSIEPKPIIANFSKYRR
jgi:hypothetical protein